MIQINYCFFDYKYNQLSNRVIGLSRFVELVTFAAFRTKHHVISRFYICDCATENVACNVGIQMFHYFSR